MIKSFLKELIIVLLLALAIILVLGILLYEYVPMAKTVPNPVAYTTPQDVKEELQASSEVDESQIILTYEINSSDLNNYKKIQDYKPGKANPFSSYVTSVPEGNGTGGQNQNPTGTSTSTGNNGSSSNNSSGGQFFQNTGTK